MENPLPETVFYTLDTARRSMNIHSDDLERMIVAGDIQACVWLPLLSAFERSGSTYGDLIHFEGYGIISRHLCSRLVRMGNASIREFRCINNHMTYVLPDSVPDIGIAIDHLRIADNELIMPPYRGSLDTDFQRVIIDDKTYTLGAVQAKICHLLHEAALAGTPWQNGKQLLHKAGSQSLTLGNVFKRHPAKHHLIESDGRGYYRLRLETINAIHQKKSPAGFMRNA